MKNIYYTIVFDLKGQKGMCATFATRAQHRETVYERTKQHDGRIRLTEIKMTMRENCFLHQKII